MRVIAGAFKGRRLKTPSWEGLRPTSDKLRETLFNILSLRVEGARVLDGFAGTGALGIEALSRGASHVTLIEVDRRAVSLIEENLAVCGVRDGYTVACGEVLAVLQRMPAGETFSLVLLDPPYDGTHAARVLDAAASRLADGGLLVLEHATRTALDVPDSLTVVRQIRSGDSTLTFLQTADRELPTA